MGERRNAEQIAADELLTDALEAVAAAYHGDRREDLGLLTDYVVITNYSMIDDEHDEASTIMVHPRNGFLPIRNQLGLVGYAHIRLQGIIQSALWDDGNPDE